MGSFLATARDGDRYASALVFRGRCHDTAGAATGSVAWATVDIDTGVSGPASGRIIDADDITHELPAAYGGPPPRITLTISVANHDNAISTLLRGASGSAATAEYGSDSVLNLTGQFFHAVKGSDGAWFERAVTPTMYLNSTVSYDGLEARLSFSSFDDNILGASKYRITVQMLIDSTAAADGEYNDRWGDGVAAYAGTAFDKQRKYFTKSRDQVVPFLYGRCAIPLIQLNAPDVDSFVKFAAFVSFVQPDLSDFPVWMLTGETSGTHTGIDSVSVSNRAFTDVQKHIIVYSIKRTVTLDDRTTKDVWFCWIVSAGNGYDNTITKQQYVTPKPLAGVHGISYGAPTATQDGPAGIIRAMVEQHSLLAGSATDSASFDLACKQIKGTEYCGILFYPGQKKIVDAYAPLLAAFGISTWVETDDKLHAYVEWSPSDKALFTAGGLYHITQSEIARWGEEIPLTPGDRGAPVTRLAPKWSSEQTRYYDKTELVPSAAGTSVIPLAENTDGDFDASAVYPPAAGAAFGMVSARRAFVARRITIIGRSWLASETRGGFYLLSHTRGLGDNSGGGYVQRSMRLISTKFHWKEDGAEAVFEDVQSLVDINVGKLDTIDNWKAQAPVAGATLTISAGSANVVANWNAGGQTFVGQVGKNLWTHGSTVGNDASKKITAVADATHCTVESVYATNETITSTGDAVGKDVEFMVMETRGTKGTGFRSAYITVCKAATFVYRDGVTPGFQYLG